MGFRIISQDLGFCRNDEICEYPVIRNRKSVVVLAFRHVVLKIIQPLYTLREVEKISTVHPITLHKWFTLTRDYHLRSGA